MSKKRKTRKQKEHAHLRQSEIVETIHIDTPTYTVAGLKNTVVKPQKAVIERDLSTTQKDQIYLKHDITAITAASGIIVALDILLFTLLSTGVFKLSFLGY